MTFTLQLLPPANEVWDKVIFSEAFAYPRGGGGGRGVMMSLPVMDSIPLWTAPPWTAPPPDSSLSLLDSTLSLLDSTLSWVLPVIFDLWLILVKVSLYSYVFVVIVGIVVVIVISYPEIQDANLKGTLWTFKQWPALQVQVRYAISGTFGIWWKELLTTALLIKWRLINS